MSCLSKEAAERNRNGLKLSHHPLSGLIRCTYCNAQYYYRESKTTEQHIYHKFFKSKEQSCKTETKYLKAEIEKVFELAVYAVFSNTYEIGTFVSSYIKDIERRNVDSLNDRATLLGQIAKVDSGIVNLVNHIHKYGSDDAVAEKLNKSRAEKDALQVRLKAFDKNADSIKEDIAKVAVSFSDDALKAFKNAKDGATKRSIYLSLIERAEIKDNQVIILFKNGKLFSMRLQKDVDKIHIDIQFTDTFPHKAKIRNEKGDRRSQPCAFA